MSSRCAAAGPRLATFRPASLVASRSGASAYSGSTRSSASVSLSSSTSLSRSGEPFAPLLNAPSCHLSAPFTHSFELVVWLVPSLIGGAVSVSLVGVLLGPVYPIIMNEAGRILPRWLLTGCVGWIAGLGQAGSAALPFMTGVIAGRVGIESLQPLCVSFSFTLAMLVMWRRLTTLQTRVDDGLLDCAMGDGTQGEARGLAASLPHSRTRQDGAHTSGRLLIFTVCRRRHGGRRVMAWLLQSIYDCVGVDKEEDCVTDGDGAACVDVAAAADDSVSASRARRSARRTSTLVQSARLSRSSGSASAQPAQRTRRASSIK
jgi:hypothetical protein